MREHVCALVCEIFNNCRSLQMVILLPYHFMAFGVYLFISHVRYLVSFLPFQWPKVKPYGVTLDCSPCEGYGIKEYI